MDADGMLAIPDGPGLGVTWSIEGIKKHSGMDASPTINALLPGPGADTLASLEAKDAEIAALKAILA